jgi:hypothetical protein
MHLKSGGADWQQLVGLKQLVAGDAASIIGHDESIGISISHWERVRYVGTKLF